MKTHPLFLLALASALAPTASAQRLPDPPRRELPAWARQQGIVMAGNWESLNYRLRDGSFTTPGGDPSEVEAGIARFKRGFTEETARKLQAMGFNFLMVPLYKGYGIAAEREQMELTKQFTAVCHRLGLHVGVYCFSGTIGWESLLAEQPDAEAWLLRDENGDPVPYNWANSRMYYRLRVNRDHPGVRAHMKELVRYAVAEAKVDLIHFDNYGIGPQYGEFVEKRFREYLARTYTPEQRRLRYGFSAVDHIKPPLPPGENVDWVKDALIRDFIAFRAATLADTYRELSEYARSLNPDVMIECNAGGRYIKRGMPSVDHAQLLPWGNAFWDEGKPSHLEKGTMVSRFRSHLYGRQFNNMVFQYTSDLVGMAESMANNLMCLGSSVWFENGELVPHVSNQPGRKEIDPRIIEYIGFFHRHIDLYRDTTLVADAAVLTTFGDEAYGPFTARQHTNALEQTLYQGRLPFTIVPAHYGGDLTRFRTVIVPELRYLDEAEIGALRAYVAGGGGLVLAGHAGKLADLLPSTPSENQSLRASSGSGRVAYVPIVESARGDKTTRRQTELVDTIRWAAGGALSIDVRAPETTSMAFYTQASGRRLLHLVNYDEKNPATDITVTLKAPSSKITLYSPDEPRPVTLASDRPTANFTVRRLVTYALVTLE